MEKDKQLKKYELLEYFAAIARGAEARIGGEMIIHNIAEMCPPQYIEDIDSYICGKLCGLVEICLEALQNVPYDRTTPIQVKSALSVLGTYLDDLSDPKLAEARELMNNEK